MLPPRFLDETRTAPPGTLSPSPFPRYGHAANTTASSTGDVYLFGGLVRESVKNDLYTVNVSAVTQPPTKGAPGSAPGTVSLGGVTATLVQTTGEIPPPRVGHATILVSNVLILWGGDTKVRADDKQDEVDDELQKRMNLLLGLAGPTAKPVPEPEPAAEPVPEPQPEP